MSMEASIKHEILKNLDGKNILGLVLMEVRTMLRAQKLTQ